MLPVLFFAFVGLAKPQATPLDREQDNFRISVDVDLVVLQATVRDRAGHTVEGLQAGDFEVFEDGRAQVIRLFQHEDTPVAVGLVVDHSASMRNKLGDVTVAAKTFVRSSNPEDRMFVVNFNERVSLGLPADTPVSNSTEQLGSAIGNSSAVGMTALYDAILVGLQGLQKIERGRKVLIVISDGGDNASKSNLDRVLKLAAQSNAVIYTIGVFEQDDPDRNPKVLRRLAHETGGEAFFPAKLIETVAFFQQIARDIRDQYTIGYSSPAAKTGAYHAIRVTAGSENRKLTVRTRAGYMTPGESPTGESARR